MERIVTQDILFENVGVRKVLLEITKTVPPANKQIRIAVSRNESVVGEALGYRLELRDHDVESI
jgi:hypothetical protein